MKFKKHVVTRTYDDNCDKWWQDYIELAKDIFWIPFELWTVFRRRVSTYITELKNHLSQVAIQLQGNVQLQDNVQESESEFVSRLNYWIDEKLNNRPGMQRNFLVSCV